MLPYSTINFKSNFESEYLGSNIINLLDSTFIIPKSYMFNIFEVTNEYIARPDLISYDAYGDSMHADVICKLNGISNPFELNVGTKLILPSPEYIMEFVYHPNEVDKDSNWGNNGYGDPNTPGSKKTKQSKRQPNEAILGDTRFKIDASSGIIIY